MVTYRYTAENSTGEPVDGHVDAGSVDEARRQLEADGLRVLEVVQADSGSPEPPPEEHLAVDEAQELAENIAQLSAAELPLGPGLRAAGDESDSPRLAKMFYHLADAIDQGRQLDEVLQSSRSVLPPHMAGLILAAANTGQLGPALTELIEHQRRTATLRQTIRDGLAYPLVVCVMATAILVFIMFYVVGGFQKIFEEFGIELPAHTLALLWLRNGGIWLALIGLTVLLVVAVVLRVWLGRSAWHRLMASTPAVGPLWHWLRLLDWIGLLRVLIRNGMPLLDALKLSADASSGNIQRLSRSLSEGVARGRPLSHLLAAEREIPASLVPLMRWGEQIGELTESFDMSCELLEDRVRTRSFWLRTVIPPVLFIFFASTILFVIGGLFIPLFNLISSLT